MLIESLPVNRPLTIDKIKKICVYVIKIEATVHLPNHSLSTVPALLVKPSHVVFSLSVLYASCTNHTNRFNRLNWHSSRDVTAINV